MSDHRTTRDVRGRAPLALLLMVLLGLPAVACGPSAKGESLVELEALRATNYTNTIRTDPGEIENPRVQPIREQAWDSIETSDNWYEAAIEAWENRESDQSEELARQGILLYRTAEAYARAADARQQIETANQTYQTQLERRNRYNDMLAANEEVIQLLQALRALYNQTEDCRAELAGFSAEQEAELRAEFALGTARSAQRTAENRRANDFASQAYEEGMRLLANAAEYIDAQQFELAFDTSQLAASRFREAMTQSESDFQDIQSDLLRNSGNEGLFDAAVAQFGDDAYVDARGLVIVVPDLFPDRRSSIRDDKTYLLDQLAEIISDGRRVDLTVEGHTSDRGSREQNLTLSNDRAEAVSEYLGNQGVRSRRLSTSGLGEDYPRFDNTTREGRADNNRIEVVFNFD